MAKSKEELQQELQEQLNIQKLALEKDFKRLEKVYKDFANTFIKRGNALYKEWEDNFNSYCVNHPLEAKRINSTLKND